MKTIAVFLLSFIFSNYSQAQEPEAASAIAEVIYRGEKISEEGAISAGESGASRRVRVGAALHIRAIAARGVGRGAERVSACDAEPDHQGLVRGRA